MRLSVKAIIFDLILVSLVLCSPLQANPTKIDGGWVQGIEEHGVTVYKGVPFAAPPVGDLKWRAPQAIIPWDGVLKAVTFAPACPQKKIAIPGFSPTEMSEDCLYLNVWTPAKSPDDKLPVMVWLYGGGFTIGATSTAMYNGENLARKGVIVVSVSYRIGPLGFLAHPALTAESPNQTSGNYGLLDQIAGLKWVQHNIQAFGGDPNCVTIFGESAGGISVSMLAASPLAKGLFHRAICQSGGSFAAVKSQKTPNCMQTLAAAEQAGLDFAKRMQADSLEALRQLSPDAWLNDPSADMGGMWPNVDGVVIVGDQYKLYESGQYNDVPVLIGSNSDEGAMFVQATQPDSYRQTIQNRFGSFAQTILSLYPANSIQETFRAQANLFRDVAFAWHVWTWARLQSRTGQSDVYLYYFDQTPPKSPLSFLMPSNGARHGSEIVYVFQNLADRYTDQDRVLSEKIATYWTNFAKHGHPNSDDLPHWPKFEEGKETVMYLKDMSKSGPVPNLEGLKVIDAYYKWQREDSVLSEVHSQN